MRVREGAPLELPHIMVLIDDPQDAVIGGCTAAKDAMQKLYSTELMAGGGSIDGYLMGEAEQNAFQTALTALLDGRELQFAMGDGNHSLATAKACYEALKQQNPDQDFSAHPARYALTASSFNPGLYFLFCFRGKKPAAPSASYRTRHLAIVLSDTPHCLLASDRLIFPFTYLRRILN